jgi:glycosyltransferase involved in cell wall biosynthesis
MSVPTVRLRGDRAAESAFSSINRRWHALLAGRTDVRLGGDGDAAADVGIDHDFSVRFGERVPADRRRVAVRPWDFGPYPSRWIDVVRQHYDELWVHSKWTVESAVAGGLEPTRVRRIPLGVDPDVMHPDGPRADLGLGDVIVFAFVGAAVRRKGIDLLLEAFRRAFGPRDPVALVIKDHTRDVFYRDQSHADVIRTAANDPALARILYIDTYMPPSELAALLRRADAFVLPYRSEGFACPVLEAMACGTPPVIPAFGACLDYCDRTTGILVPTREVALPVGRTMQMNSLGFAEEIDRVHFCETSADQLAAALRATVEMPTETRLALGRAAAARARQWTWAASVETIVQGVKELAER